MSTAITMVLVINLLSILFSPVLVRSDQTMVPLISFKLSENVMYDCIDIYKQPGLDHILLRNHTIQMKPSVSRSELKNQTRNNKTYKKKIWCPYETVPVLRNAKKFMTNTQFVIDQYFHPLSVDSPGTHIAGVRSRNGPFHGVEAYNSGYTLGIGKDQVSYSNIYIGSGLNKEINFISRGWMINPGFFPDGRIWAYGFWKGKDGKECYNTACPGFVQVSREVPIAEPIDTLPEKPTWMHNSIHQDKQTGNWWLTKISKGVPDIDIGYWPKELFNLLDNGANITGAAGVVHASPSVSSPPMGNSRFPNGDHLKESAIFANIEVLDSNYKKQKMNSSPIEKLLDSTKCYGLRIGKVPIFYVSKLGFFFNYGGPGGYSCGI